jgi:hypothetical protein
VMVLLMAQYQVCKVTPSSINNNYNLAQLHLPLPKLFLVKLCQRGRKNNFTREAPANPTNWTGWEERELKIAAPPTSSCPLQGLPPPPAASRGLLECGPLGGGRRGRRDGC